MELLLLYPVQILIIRQMANSVKNGSIPVLVEQAEEINPEIRAEPRGVIVGRTVQKV